MLIYKVNPVSKADLSWQFLHLHLIQLRCHHNVMCGSKLNHICECLRSIIYTCSPAFPSYHASPSSCCRRGCTWSCIAGQTHYPCRRHGDLGCPPTWWSAVNAGPPGDTLWGRQTWYRGTRPRHHPHCLSQVWRGNERGNGERREEFRCRRQRRGKEESKKRQNKS